MKVVLAFPAKKRHLADHSTGLLPLGFLSMASRLQRAGHDVTAIHLGRYRSKDAVSLLLDSRPDVVGLSCFTFQRHETLELAASIRKASAAPFIVVGGPHAAPLGREILQRVPAVDAVATGEGERTIVDLVERLRKGEDPRGTPGLATRGDDGPPASLLENLDVLSTEITFPVLGVSVPYQMRHLMASRGCSANCTFCRAPAAWGRHVRRRSVASLLAQVADLRKRHDAAYLSFRDDTFTADREWVREFCRGLIERDSDVLWDCQTRATAIDAETADLMRLAGCVQVQIGLESGSDRVLRALRKPFTVSRARQAVDACRAAGLCASLYLIYGVPGETEDDIEETEAFVRQSRPSSLSVARLSCYPGTALAANVPADAWFREKGGDLHAWDDPAALRHGERFRALGEEVRAGEPFTVEELREASQRLKGRAPALALATLLERTGRPAEAEKAWSDLLAEWPGYVWAELGLGECLLERGRPGDAEPHLRRAAELAPRWSYPLDRLGWALSLQGREREGQALVTRALELDPCMPPPPPPQGCRDGRAGPRGKRRG